MLTDEQIINIMKTVDDYGKECYMDGRMGLQFNTDKLTLVVGRAAIEAEVRKEIESTVLAEREACAQLVTRGRTAGGRCVFPIMPALALRKY